MTLKTLFAIPVTIILLVTLALASVIASQGWTGQQRSKEAVRAVENMRLLLLLQSDLRSERVATNLALGKQLPLLESIRAGLEEARQESDGRIAHIVTRLRRLSGSENNVLPEPYLATLVVRLGMSRAAADQLLALPRHQRSFTAQNAIQPLMTWASLCLEQPIARAGVAVTAAEPGLSGLLTEERLATSMRDHVGLIAGVTMPRANTGEQLTDFDLEKVRVLVAQSSYLLRLMRHTIEIVGATEPMLTALTDLELADQDGVLRRLTERAEGGTKSARDNIDFVLPQPLLAPWGEKVNVLRLAIVDALVTRVSNERVARERKFDLVMTGFGVVVIAVLASVFLLSRRVVSPLAQLGVAITRIAGGDRSVPLAMRSSTREIMEMATAVETLRQAALVADAAAMRQRMAARQRLLLLREALGIAQTVREPARALERDVAQLSAGIDATIALVTATNAPPPTLSAAAAAVRAGLEHMRRSTAGLDATFAAASGAQSEDRPPEEFVAHIRAMEAEVDRRDVAVRAFIQPSLVALRDTTAAMPAQALRDLVSDQFHRIEATVATVAAMRDAMTRAASIVRDLPLDDAPLAA